jgi:hypothetical protein
MLVRVALAVFAFAAPVLAQRNIQPHAYQYEVAGSALRYNDGLREMPIAGEGGSDSPTDPSFVPRPPLWPLRS